MLLAFYPLSVWYYQGQLTDPLSHALFVLSLIYVVQDRWLALAASLAPLTVAGSGVSGRGAAASLASAASIPAR